MTHEQILKKAIKKAVKNGWDKDIAESVEYDMFNNDWPSSLMPWAPFTFIFNHSFAKKFFGEGYERATSFMKRDGKELSKEVIELSRQINAKQNWQYNLQEMVLKKDPILYLKRFL